MRTPCLHCGTQGLYAHAWSFVHFLNHGQGGKYRPRFEEMLKLTAKGGGGRAFDRAFQGVDRKQLEREWHGYVEGL